MSIEQRVSKMERTVSTVEDAIKLLSQLVASPDDRLFESLIKDEDLSSKITILIDAQIRGEDKIQNINEALDKLTELVKTAYSRLTVWKIKAYEESI